jgi:hypothetical protein
LQQHIHHTSSSSKDIEKIKPDKELILATDYNPQSYTLGSENDEQSDAFAAEVDTTVEYYNDIYK